MRTANLGFPRMGQNREWKKAVEKFWKQKIEDKELHQVAEELKVHHWKLQKEAHIDIIPSNDFSYYDHVLDMICLVGAIPERYQWGGGKIDNDLYFAMARGRQNKELKVDVTAMEMTKWFNTNYHFIVPELSEKTEFKLCYDKVFQDYELAKKHQIDTRPVLVGPATFLHLSKTTDGSNKYDLLDRLLPVYQEVLNKLAVLGAAEVQMDEPMLVLDLNVDDQEALLNSYQYLEQNTSIDLMVTTYFGGPSENLNLLSSLPVKGVHLDLVEADLTVEQFANLRIDKTISLGIIDGRNIWKNDFKETLSKISPILDTHPNENIILASSCSLLHSPFSLKGEDKIPKEIKRWMAFATEKLEELSSVKKIVLGNSSVAEDLFEENQKSITARRASHLVRNSLVRANVEKLKTQKTTRSPFSKRIKKQNSQLNLPLFPTTTIGSFPQTTSIRKTRADYKKGLLNKAEYEEILKEKTKELMAWQDEVGIDVPVHGEYERNDMVEYFGEKLEGFVFTQNGWVQSYGSRCVKPPIIYGDVARTAAMTVDWSVFAQSLTEKPVKGMLTGPITILHWSFVRNDQPLKDTCKQIALAIREEVIDLEANGIKIVQIDEPALREGLPLRKGDWQYYLDWSVDCFKIASTGISDTTQIHTHLCYSEFNDIIESIAALDADVISIETSRSAMELLDAFQEFQYPNQIGPGVYDIHSPRVPEKEELTKLLEKALKVLPKGNIWVNPDCGLKTRDWVEVDAALRNMVEAAKILRAKVG